jgi:hypothetical protein
MPINGFDNSSKGQEQIAAHADRRNLTATRGEVGIDEIGAGAERVAHTSDDDRANVVVGLGKCAHLTDEVHLVRRDRIAPLGPIDRDREPAIANGKVDSVDCSIVHSLSLPTAHARASVGRFDGSGRCFVRVGLALTRSNGRPLVASRKGTCGIPRVRRIGRQRRQ